MSGASHRLFQQADWTDDSRPIAGVGMTQFGRSSNTLVEIMRAAAVSALAISKVQDFDAIYIAVMNPKNTPAALISLHMSPKRSDSEESRR